MLPKTSQCWFLAWRLRGANRPRPPSLEMRALSACVRVAVFVYLCYFSKGNLVFGAAGLCMLGEP